MHVLWALLALILVLYLVYAEISLRALCEWCTAVHVLVLAPLPAAIARWQRAPAAAVDVGVSLNR